MQVRIADSETPSQKTLPLFRNRRKAERESMHWRVTYTYEAGGSNYIVDGATRDFGKTGCGIRGTIMPPVGSKTCLKVYAPNRNYPISLYATVAWVAGDNFGVRFPKMDRKDYMRVRQYMGSVLKIVA